MKKLAEEIDIEYDKFDLLIDTMCGDPLDIFRAQPKEPPYSI